MFLFDIAITRVALSKQGAVKDVFLYDGLFIQSIQQYLTTLLSYALKGEYLFTDQ